jgi:hypothetical protein
VADNQQQFSVSRINSGRSVTNPAYPDGADLDLSNGATLTCVCSYTSRGLTYIRCLVCGSEVHVTTLAGGNVKLGCKTGTATEPYATVDPLLSRRR